MGVSKNYPRQTRLIDYLFFVPCLIIMVIQVFDSTTFKNHKPGVRRKERL